MSEKTQSFDYYLEYFPEIEPPLTLTNKVIKDISKSNKPLPGQFIYDYLVPWHGNIDEFTEFIPCFSLKNEDNFYTIVYWKGSLLSHEYYLATIDTKTSTLISKKVIGGTISDGKKVVECVAKIEEDQTIHLMTGKIEGAVYNPTESQAIYMEILPSGMIESYKEDNPLSWLKENTSSKN